MSTSLSAPFKALNRLGLIPQIVIGILCGIAVATLSPELAASVSLLGQVFISALKAVAPVLVFVLVMAAIAGHQRGQPTQIHSVLVLYLIGTLVAALVAVVAS
ncbi:cation:dicarboxylate symporter family transporter, partial [Parasedimentitalea maritima]